MGPYEIDVKSLLVSVLTDWRVVAAFVAFFLLGALLRYVGLVFNQGSRINLPAPRRMIKRKAKEAPPPAADFEDEA